MKRLVILLLLVFAAVSVWAKDWKVTLSHEKLDMVRGFKIYWRVKGSNYSQVVDIGKTLHATIPNVPDDVVICFTATAYNEGGESPPSNEVCVFCETCR